LQLLPLTLIVKEQLAVQRTDNIHPSADFLLTGSRYTLSSAATLAQTGRNPTAVV